MAVRGPDATAVGMEHSELDQTSASLWNPQMYEQSEIGPGKASVHLPNTDGRQPLEKRASDLEATSPATHSDQQSSFTPSLSSSYSSSSSFENHQRPSFEKDDQNVNEPRRDPFPRGSRGRGDPRNAGIRAAKLRYQQEKLARQEAAEKAHKASGVVPHASVATSSGSGSPPRSMDSLASTSSARKAGSQPVVRLPKQTSSAPYRMEPPSQNPSSSFLSHHTTPNKAIDGVHNQSSFNCAPDQSYHRPPPRPFDGQYYASNRAIHFGRAAQDDWTQWPELSLKISDLPPATTTRDIYKHFSQEGNVVVIELFENSRGERDGKAVVRFSPPPARPFWEVEYVLIPITGLGNVPIRLNLDPRKRTFLHPSPVDHNKRYPESMVLYAKSLDLGLMLDETTMMKMCTSFPTSNARIKFCQNMLRREITVEFPVHIQDPRKVHVDNTAFNMGRYNRIEYFRFCIPFSQPKMIHEIQTEAKTLGLLISLPTPPRFFKQIDKTQSHDDAAKFWKDNDAWYRQTDVVYDPNQLKKKPLTLQKMKPVIDLGRWTTYRFLFDMSKNDSAQFDQMRQALRDYNVEILPFPRFRTALHTRPAVWRFLDPVRRIRNDLDELIQEVMPTLAFEVRYQLEVCISHGFLNEHNLDRAFVHRLMSLRAGQARDLLEYIANHGQRMFNPMALFQIPIGDGALLRSKIPHYCVYIRSATVTPTTVHFQTPVAETSNRVIRQYAAYADRFLRVRFTDEKSEGAIYATDKNTMNEVFTRVKRVLTNGIAIGDRKYEYLASGNSQFRDHGAYFFAPLPHLPMEKIRDWMGQFTEIKTVPLYAARLGQCFSTTRAIHGAPATLVEIPDIKRNGYNFTDGVGRISPFLARLAATELGIMHHSPDPPSVFQIRLGGCKGIVALSPHSGAREIHIRESQYKFPAKHEGLEIIRWSQYACANLNRQLILILSALGVPDHVFVQKMRLQLSKLEQAMTDEPTALNILQKDIDHNQMTLAVASMILDGFQRSEEPFLMSLLQLWRAWSIKYLKEKARVTIGGGALLFGCVDETAILRGHFDNIPRPSKNASIREKARYVPEVFVQLSKGSGDKPEVILGPMLLARNPSLHPGDVRVVCGVNVPELHHLKDVVVLPQTGDRDVAGMCSGGDLDGDDFLVIWDHDLLPHEWNVEPMDYARPPIPKHDKNIGIDGLTTFFVTYMKNDTLSRIAQAHLANADFLEQGVKDEKCLKLAALHSMAVDYVKTGLPAQMSPDLKPRKRPHFMNNEHQAADKIYISRKVLGQLYDQVERVDFVPFFTLPFDDRILVAYDLGADALQSASDVKKEYDAHMRRIMAQHEIKTEFEVWSTFVLQHTKTTNAFKFHEVIGELSLSLKEQFRALCLERAGGKDFERLGPFVAAMYKVTSAQMVSALKECQRFQSVGGQRRPLRDMTPEKMPLMSFPWLFPDILGKIAKRKTQTVDQTLPVYQQATSSAEAWQALEATRATFAATQSKRTRQVPSLLDAEDDLETAEGVTHRGEVLELFDKCSKTDHSSTDEDHKTTPSNDGVAVSLASRAEANMTPASPGLGSTGLRGPSFESAHRMDESQGRQDPTNSYKSPLSGKSDSSPVYTSFSNASSVAAESSLDLDKKSPVNGGSLDGDGRNEDMPKGSNLQILREFMSDSESESEGSVVHVEIVSNDKNNLSTQIYKDGEKSVRPTEDDVQDRKQKIPKADKGREEVMEIEEEEEDEGKAGDADESDAETEEVEIRFSTKPGVLDQLANLGADDSQPRLHYTEAKVVRPDARDSNSESMPGSQAKNTPTKRLSTNSEYDVSEKHVLASTSPGPSSSETYNAASTGSDRVSSHGHVPRTEFNTARSN